jgi:uncharacterized protein involved in cysteine biosynthesis
LSSALAKAFAQLDDARLQRIVLLSIGLALAVLLVLGVGSWFLIAELSDVSIGWLDWLIDAAAGLGVVILIWFLFPTAISATIGLFLEAVAAAVEARHYPGLSAPRAQSVREAILSGAKFAVVAILLNLAALPVYLIGFFLPPLNFLVFYGLNGYLLGREYYETVALRRLAPSQADKLRRREGWRIFWAGVVIAVLLTVPILNLIAPVIATAFMLHIFEALRRNGPSA